MKRPDFHESAHANAPLEAAHARLQKLFLAFQKARHADAPAEEKRVIVEQICESLAAQTLLEDEVLYPAVREAMGDDALMDRFDANRVVVRDLTALVGNGDVDAELFDASVVVLGEYLNRKLRFHRDEVLVKAGAAGLDLMALMRAMDSRGRQAVLEESRY